MFSTTPLKTYILWSSLRLYKEGKFYLNLNLLVTKISWLLLCTKETVCFIIVMTFQTAQSNRSGSSLRGSKRKESPSLCHRNRISWLSTAQTRAPNDLADHPRNKFMVVYCLTEWRGLEHLPRPISPNQLTEINCSLQRTVMGGGGRELL